LVVKELKSRKIPLQVSERLQHQIYFLCSEVDSAYEWSGTLFYTVEGELGEDNFKITAQELYLQDIGTKTYTEYDPGNPTFIKFLFENPRFLEMKQGHIHSHNTMPVFFSDTDNDEIRDNSEFHNYYLSLIVNNRNEMCAKVAFRATEKRETKSIVSYRGGNGQMRQKEVTGETEESSVYAYNCDITTTDIVGESFSERFLQVEKDREDKEKMAKKAKEMAKSHFPPKEKGDKGEWREVPDAYKGWKGEDRYRQVGLYDDVRLPHEGRDAKKRDKKEDRHRGILTTTDKYPKETWTGSVSDIDYDRRRSRSTDRFDPNVYSFLVKLLSRDFLAEGRLGQILEELDKRFFGPNSESAEERNLYMDSLDHIAVSHYINCFPGDFNIKEFNPTLDRAIELLELSTDAHPELIEELTDALTFAMDE
jgi:hypothetical protein